MVGQKCYKSEKQKQIIEQLQRYWEFLLHLKKSLFFQHINTTIQTVQTMESLLNDLQTYTKDNKDVFFTSDIQSILLKIKELQKQIFDYSAYHMKKLGSKKPNKKLKTYYSY